MKIAFPHLKITLLDSLNKRIKVSYEVIRELGLQEIKTIHGRAEDFAKQKEYREQYDLCVSRAVANLATLSDIFVTFHIQRLEDSLFLINQVKFEKKIDASRKAVIASRRNSSGCREISASGKRYWKIICSYKKEKATAKKYPRKGGFRLKSH